MATMNQAEVTVGSALATGAIWVAPTTVPLPSDATTALASGFGLLGFTSDAGVTISESSSRTPIRAWEGRTTLFNLVTEYTEQVSFTPIQCNAEVAELMWGEDAVVSGTGTIHAKHHGAMLDPVHIVIETTPRTGIVKRFCLKAQLSARGEMTMNGTQVDGRQLTFDSIADADGVTMHEYTAMS